MLEIQTGPLWVYSYAIHNAEFAPVSVFTCPHVLSSVSEGKNTYTHICLCIDYLSWLSASPRRRGCEPAGCRCWWDCDCLHHDSRTMWLLCLWSPPRSPLQEVLGDLDTNTITEWQQERQQNTTRSISHVKMCLCKIPPKSSSFLFLILNKSFTGTWRVDTSHKSRKINWLRKHSY